MKSILNITYFVALLTVGGMSASAVALQQGFGNTAEKKAEQEASSDFGQQALDWRREFGSGEGLRTFSAMVIDHADQSIVLAGLSQMPEITKLFTQKGNPIEQLIVQKIDFFGNSLWIKPFSLSVTDPNRARSVSLMADGSYLISGYHGGIDDMQNYAVKVDAEGNEVWKRRVGGVGDFVYHIQQTSDDGFMVVGKKNYKGAKVSWLAKFNNDMRMIGEALYEDKSIGKLHFKEDGSFYTVAINTNPETHEKNLCLCKFSATGEVLAQDFSMPEIDLGNRRLGLSHVEFGENTILVAGSATDFSRGDREKATMWLAELNYQGEMLWSKLYEHDGEVASFAYLDRNEAGLVGSMRLQDHFGDEVNTYFVRLTNKGELTEKTAMSNNTISDVKLFDDGSVLVTGERELNIKKYRSGRSYVSSVSYIERKQLD